MDEEWRVWGVLGWRLVNLTFEGGRSPVGHLVSGGVITVALTPQELELRLWHLILSGEKKDPYFHLAHRAWSHRFDPELGLRVEWRDPQQPSVVQWTGPYPPGPDPRSFVLATSLFQGCDGEDWEEPEEA